METHKVRQGCFIYHSNCAGIDAMVTWRVQYNLAGLCLSNVGEVQRYQAFAHERGKLSERTLRLSMYSSAMLISCPHLWTRFQHPAPCQSPGLCDPSCLCNFLLPVPGYTVPLRYRLLFSCAFDFTLMLAKQLKEPSQWCRSYPLNYLNNLSYVRSTYCKLYLLVDMVLLTTRVPTTRSGREQVWY